MGSFLSTDVLTASVWAGSNHVPLLTPTVSWLDAALAQIQVAVQNADSLGLAYGVYYLQAFATRAGTPPRSTALLPVRQLTGDHRQSGRRIAQAFLHRHHGPAEDCPWIDDLQVPDSHEGFDDQCADSRDWLDEMTLRNYRGGNVSLLGLQPIMPLDLPVKVRSWELTVYPRSYIRRWPGVTRPAKART